MKYQISAKADQLSASLAKVRREIAGLPALAKQASNKTGELDPFGGGKGRSLFGLDRVEKQIGRLYGSARVGASGLTGGIGLAARSIPGLGLVAGAASIAGIGEMMSSLASAGVELTNTSRLAGTTAAGLNSMRGAARLMGLSAGTADQAMLGLNHTIQDAVYGKNAEALNYFKLAGIDIGSIATGAKSADAVLPKVVDSLTKAAKTNPLAAEQLAQIWGVPSAALPMLIKGRDALQASRLEIERMYGSFDKYTESSEHFTYSTARLGLASERLGQTIMTSLEPHLTPMLVSLSSWIDDHGKDVGPVFDRIGKAIEGVHWSEVGAGIDQVGKAILTAASYAEDFGVRINRVLETLRAVRDFTKDPGKSFQLQTGSQGWATFVAQHPESEDYASPRERAGAGVRPMFVAGDFGAGTVAPPSQEQERRGRQGRDILTNLGWSPKQAAGIMANLHRESKFSEGAVGDNGTAYGIAQWHSDRLAKLRAGMGRDVVGMSFEDQVRAVDWELRHNEKAAGDALRRTTTAAEAGDVVSRMYERPGATEAEASTRARSADAFDRRWSSAGPARSPQLTLPDTSATTTPNGGKLEITIDHQNAPAGVTMTPKLQSHSAELAGVRVRRAMPEAGHRGSMPPWGWVD